jgi:hypothetical protein
MVVEYLLIVVLASIVAVETGKHTAAEFAVEAAAGEGRFEVGHDIVV